MQRLFCWIRDTTIISIEFILKKPWTVAKFLILFTASALFVSYNFYGWIFGISIATIITALSVAHRRIFDDLSDTFFEIKEDDDINNKSKKIATTLFKRILYYFIDYGLATLSVFLVVLASNSGFSYLTVVAIMWLVIDLPSTAIFVMVYEKTGHDMTLGRSYRRMANKVLEHSKLAGMIVFSYEIVLASFWSGPDYTILFFRDELKTKTVLGFSLLIITLTHAFLWTTLYWFGYKNIVELTGYCFDVM